jgi:hypothetical protein
MSKPVDDDGKPIRGYRRRMYDFWKERACQSDGSSMVRIVSEQRLCDQARMIRKNGWLSEVELVEIRNRVLSPENSNESEVVDDSCSVELCDHSADREQQYDCSIHVPVGNIVMDNGVVGEDRVVCEKIVQICEELASGVGKYRFDFKAVDRKVLMKEVVHVNEVLEFIETSTITETNWLIRAVSVYVAKRLGLKNFAERKVGCIGSGKEPWWRRRLQQDVRELRRNISILESKLKGELRCEWKYKMLLGKLEVKKKGVKVVMEELKQRLVAKKVKIKRYEQRIQQFRQNRLFGVDQRRFFQQINGSIFEKVIPDAQESIKFWDGIWGTSVNHNENASWLRELKEKEVFPRQEDLVIDEDCVRRRSKRMSNWKSPGVDGVQGFWIKYLPVCHSRIARQLNDILSGRMDVPQWLTYGRTILCLKDPSRGDAVDNFRPICCLPLMWKLMTGVIADSMYDFLEENGILPVEQKGCKRNSRGTKDQLLIDKMVLKDCRKRRTNLMMAWIDYKKAYDMVPHNPHSWIKECLGLFGCADIVQRFILVSMNGWKCELTAGEQVLGEVNINRGIFQGDSLSPLLYVLCMIPLT